MLHLSLNELKSIAKSRSIKCYKSMSEERLLSSLNESESVKESKKNSDDARIKNIKKDFNELKDRFFEPKIKEIRKDIYRIKNIKKSFHTKKNRDWKKFSWIGKESSPTEKVLWLWWYWIRTMHTKSNNIETMMDNEAGEIIEELFESLLKEYQEGLEEKMRGS